VGTRGGAYDLEIRTRPRFLTVHLSTKFHHPTCLIVQKISRWQTNKEILLKISTSFRRATSVERISYNRCQIIFLHLQPAANRILSFSSLMNRPSLISIHKPTSARAAVQAPLQLAPVSPPADSIWLIYSFNTPRTVFTRDSVAIARICYGNSVCPFVCLSVRPSVCHTGGSVKNGWS